MVRSLCRKKPEDRIVMQRGGLSNLSELPFFADLDWEEVANHKFPAPFQPEGADYTKIGNRQLSSSFEIEWEELVPWLFDAEEDLEKHHQERPRPSYRSSGSRSLADLPTAAAAATGASEKWKGEQFDDFGLAGM